LVKQKLGQAIGGKAIDKATVVMSAHVWAHNEITVARTICIKASSWCGNRNAIDEADGVSEVTGIVHHQQETLCKRFMS